MTADQFQNDGLRGKDLGRREWQLLTLMVIGLTDEEIAAELDISLRSIKLVKFVIRAKLDVSTSAAAIVKAHKLRLISGQHLDC